MDCLIDLTMVLVSSSSSFTWPIASWTAAAESFAIPRRWFFGFWLTIGSHFGSNTTGSTVDGFTSSSELWNGEYLGGIESIILELSQIWLFLKLHENRSLSLQRNRKINWRNGIMTAKYSSWLVPVVFKISFVREIKWNMKDNFYWEQHEREWKNIKLSAVFVVSFEQISHCNLFYVL